MVSGCKGGGRTIAVWDVSKPSAPVATFNVPVDVLHLAFHPSRDQFAAVCPQRTRDEVFFYWKVERDGEWKWEERKDVMIGGVGADVGVEEVGLGLGCADGRSTHCDSGLVEILFLECRMMVV